MTDLINDQSPSPFSRRSFVAGLPIVALSAGTAGAVQATDPIPQWFEVWSEGRAQWRVEANRPGAENLDTPECLALDESNERLAMLIANATPTTVKGAICQLRWVYEDSDGDTSDCPMYTDAFASALDFLKEVV